MVFISLLILIDAKSLRSKRETDEGSEETITEALENNEEESTTQGAAGQTAILVPCPKGRISAGGYCRRKEKIIKMQEGEELS
ncbi:hypothetical protein PVAND_013958 [Polypedilum vanderplanki]|uniref:Uncharacterized protein n=1 Tax=Polypedilum vanderplanki TaxID=319348 RepID=A0A9J6CS32_POLVA|nr:hypothetical protein PVAND_013958 [Polypedilum vanderplanki]